MKIGFSIFLLAVGAILSFAVKDAISGVNLAMVGYIMMGAGAIGLIITLIMMSSDRKSIHTETRTVNGEPVLNSTTSSTQRGIDTQLP